MTRLWVVTAYYNPAGYRRRLANFRAFARHLTAPLLVVELAREGGHQLGADAADRVLRLTGEDRLWQKERLINLAAAALPDHVTHVAWVDCDVLFENPDWPEEAMALLARQGGMVQPFETAAYMPETLDPATVTLAQCQETPPILTAMAAAETVRRGEFDRNDAGRNLTTSPYDEAPGLSPPPGYNCYGMAWVARRADLMRCGLYDRNVLGGADAVAVFAGLGKPEGYWANRAHNAAMRAHAEDWMGRALTAGLIRPIGNLDRRVFHLWHGDVANRKYRARHQTLVDLGYDPARDVVAVENGTLRWTEPDGPLARAARAYFEARREDGGDVS